MFSGWSELFFIHGKCKAGFLVQGGSLALISSLASFGADSPQSDQSFLFFYILYCACFCVARKERAHFFCVVILCQSAAKRGSLWR